MSLSNHPNALSGGASPSALSVIGGTGQFADGSAASPSLTLVSDTDTGFYRDSSNVLKFTAAGVYSLALSASGAISGTQGGNSIQLDSAGAIILTASGTNQNITVTPSGTGATNFSTAINVTGEIQSVSARVNYNLSTYGAGTAYSLTNTAAAVVFGTTNPVIVLDKTGTYRINAQIHLAYTGATIVAETASVKVRRTNNTAADLSAIVVIDLPVATTLTYNYGIIPIPPFYVTTANTNDSITIFASVSATLGVGTINATAIGTSIIAERMY